MYSHPFFLTNKLTTNLTELVLDRFLKQAFLFQIDQQ